MLVWGHDPGERNYGYAVIKLGKKTRILEIGQVMDTLRNLTHKAQKPPKSRRGKEPDAPPLKGSVVRYIRLVDNLMVEFGVPHEVYSERFQTRGVKSKSVESVSMMNGMLCLRVMLKGAYFHTMIAGTWKNAINRAFAKVHGAGVSLDDLYAFGKLLGFTPHEIDAVCIALTRGGQTPPPHIKRIKKMLKEYHARQGIVT